MNEIILILLHYLSDLDKIQLLKTCKTFYTLRSQTAFTRKYDYNKIKRLSFLKHFVNISVTTSTGLKPEHEYVTEVVYPRGFNRDITYISPHIRNILILSQQYEGRICKIPESVESIKLFTEVMGILTVADGGKIIYVELDGSPITTVTRESGKKLVIEFIVDKKFWNKALTKRLIFSH